MTSLLFHAARETKRHCWFGMQRIQSAHLLTQTRTRIAYISDRGAGNLGDDAMYGASRRLLSRATVVPFKHPYLERRFGRLGLAGPRYFGAAVVGGGTLITPFPYWIEQTKVALAQGLPVMTLGTGVGSCGFEMAHAIDLGEWKALLPDFHRIGVRGPLSQQALAAAGIPQAEVIGDLALSLTQERALPLAPRPSIALNLSMPKTETYGQGEFAWLPELENALAARVREGWQLVPFAMHDKDVAVIRQLLQRLSLDHLSVPVLRTEQQFFQRVGPCAFTMALRLHAAVLSCCVGVPPLMLGYRDKCLDFMQSMQLEAWHVALHPHTSGEITEKALRLASQEAEALRPVVLSRARAWKHCLENYVRTHLPA